jgi:hypothetical protein
MAERVDPGDPIYAEEFNKLRRAAEASGRITGGGGVKISSTAGGLSVRGMTHTAFPKRAVTEARGINVSNEDFLAYQPCVVFGNMFTGSKAEGIPLFKLDWPMSGDEGFFSICLEPIKVGRTGRIAIAGMCLARVKNPKGQWNAECVPDEDFLLGTDAGTAQLAAQPIEDENVHLCLIRFPVGGVGGGARQFKIVSLDYDHVNAKTWDGTTLGDDIVKIAKPWLLRKTPFISGYQGITFTYTGYTTRSATLSGTTETQVVVPAYNVNDIIYATKGVAGGLAMTDPDIEWADLNIDGRAWARQ